MKEMEATGNFLDIDSNFRENIKELAVVPNREQARLRGISIADLGQTMNALVGGKVIGKFTKERFFWGRSVPYQLQHIKSNYQSNFNEIQDQGV
jgi:multidrug efflux pump subunit AcrB